MEEHRRGPVRSEAARSAILGATARLFESLGYERLTMEGIAAEAKVGKQTIYRWWPNKGALVADCLIEGLLFSRALIPPDTGELRRDLEAWMEWVIDFIDKQGGEALVRSLISAATEAPQVGERLNESLGASTMLLSRLRRAVQSGELSVAAPLEEMAEALIGVVVMRALSRTPNGPGAATRLVSAVLGPPSAAGAR